MRDDDQGKPTQDSDRAAILARRKQFIALALSGLTTTAACTDGTGGDGKTPTQKADSNDEPRNDPPVEQPPQVCLSVAIEPQPEDNPPVPETDPPVPETDPESPGDRPQIPPNVCLKIVRPPEEPPPETAPRPCLKKMPPKPG